MGGRRVEHTSVHAGMEWVDTSVQKIVYGTLERTSHTRFGRALPFARPATAMAVTEYVEDEWSVPYFEK